MCIVFVLRIFIFQCSMFNVQCSMFNVQCSMFKIILNSGYGSAGKYVPSLEEKSLRMAMPDHPERW